MQIKYDCELDLLGDYQILEISKDKNLDSEFNEILGKVTELASFVLRGGHDV